MESVIKDERYTQRLRECVQQMSPPIFNLNRCPQTETKLHLLEGADCSPLAQQLRVSLGKASGRKLRGNSRGISQVEVKEGDGEDLFECGRGWRVAHVLPL